MKVIWDTSYHHYKHANYWETGLSILSVKLFLLQYVGLERQREFRFYLLGAGVTLTWEKK